MAPKHSHLLKVGGRYMLRYESYLAGIKALSITKKQVATKVLDLRRHLFMSSLPLFMR